MIRKIRTAFYLAWVVPIGLMVCFFGFPRYVNYVAQGLLLYWAYHHWKVRCSTCAKPSESS